MMTKALMYWLKPLVLILAVVVMAHANCAVSCVHPHSGKVPVPESTPQSPENCHHSKTPVKSDEDKSGSACSHAQISGDRPQITAQQFKPIAAVVTAEVVPFVSEIARISALTELFGPSAYGSAPPITVLRI
jgi:hypothetical protein